MLKRKRKLTAMLLALAVMLGGLQQFTMPGVKAQAVAKTNVTAKSQAAADVKSNSVKSKNAIKKNTRTKGKLKGEDIMAPAVPVTGSAIDDDELPRMDVSIKQGDSKNIKLNWNSYEGADYYCVFYVKGSFEQPSEDEGKINYINQNFVYNETEFTLEVSRGQDYSFCVVAYSGEDVAIARTDKLTSCIPKKNSVRFTRLNSRKVKLSWNKSAGADKYIIYKKINNNKYKKLAETKKLKYKDGKVRAG